MTPKRVGLTGGIGSGKSTVANMLHDWAVPVLDLDEVGHDCLRDETVKARLKEAFGQHIVDEQGVLLRSRLATEAFCNQQATARLNAIMHPAIVQQEERWVQQQDAVYVVIEASVLLESSGAARMDGVLAVLASLDIRRQRVLQRGRQDASMFAQIVARQCDDALRAEQSDWVLRNDDSRSLLHQKVRAWHAQRMQDFR